VRGRLHGRPLALGAMPTIGSYVRRFRAIIVTLLVVAAVAGIATILARDEAAVPESEALDPHVLLDDVAAGAEVAALLASLRAGLALQTSPDLAGTHARRMADQVAASAEVRRLRSPQWEAVAQHVADMRTRVATADVAAIDAVTELEERLRAASP
jgi:hypothetical protein